MTDRPDVSARGSIDVFEAHRVLAWHDEKMAGRDGVQVHEDNNGLVLVHHAGLGLSRHNGAEDALLRCRCRVLCHVRNSFSASRQVQFSCCWGLTSKIRGMVHWYESSIDRQLREAQERGEFDNLEGAGKPLPDAGREYDEDWWVKDWLRREGDGSGVLPATLALRREVEDLPQIVDRLRYEAAVRER